MDFTGTGRPMTEAGMAAALTALGMDTKADLPALWAVLTVESRGFGFLPDRRPKILFERHIFFRQTAGRFAADAPDICAKTGGGLSSAASSIRTVNGRNCSSPLLHLWSRCLPGLRRGRSRLMRRSHAPVAQLDRARAF